jgi:hypothetical protein
LFPTPKAAPSLPTLYEHGPRPVALTLKPYAAAELPPSEVVVA